MKKYFSFFIGLASLGFVLGGCAAKGDDPGNEFAPDMYVSKGYEPFSQVRKNPFSPGGANMMLPVKGTIARGQLDYQYPYPDNIEGYEASAALANPVPKTWESVEEGKRLSEIFCWSCHGKTGANDGPVMSEDRFPKPGTFQSYQDNYIKNLPDGKIYHVITFGKNLMGSHAIMLSPQERWVLTNYLKYLSLGENFKFDSEADPREISDK
jgi:hypothetical protein